MTMMVKISNSSSNKDYPNYCYDPSKDVDAVKITKEIHKAFR